MNSKNYESMKKLKPLIIWNGRSTIHSSTAHESTEKPSSQSLLAGQASAGRPTRWEDQISGRRDPILLRLDASILQALERRCSIYSSWKRDHQRECTWSMCPDEAPRLQIFSHVVLVHAKCDWPTNDKKVAQSVLLVLRYEMQDVTASGLNCKKSWWWMSNTRQIVCCYHQHEDPKKKRICSTTRAVNGLWKGANFDSLVYLTVYKCHS